MNLFGYIYSTQGYYQQLAQTTYNQQYIGKWIANCLSLVPQNVPYSVTTSKMSDFYHTVYTELQYNNKPIQELDLKNISPRFQCDGKYINPPTVTKYDNSTKSIDYFLSYANNLPGCLGFSIDTDLMAHFFIVPDEINKTPTSKQKYGVSKDNSNITLRYNKNYIFTFCKYIQCIYNCVDNQCLFDADRRNYTRITPFTNNFSSIIEDYFNDSYWNNIKDIVGNAAFSLTFPFLQFQRSINTEVMNGSTAATPAIQVNVNQYAIVTKDTMREIISNNLSNSKYDALYYEIGSQYVNLYKYYGSNRTVNYSITPNTEATNVSSVKSVVYWNPNVPVPQ